jgi:hypothetical protein
MRAVLAAAVLVVVPGCASVGQPTRTHDAAPPFRPGEPPAR